MTVRKFAEKYGITSSLAYLASKDVEPVANLFRDRDFSEDELFRATMRIIDGRIRDCSEKLRELQKTRSMVKWKRMNS